MLEITNRTLSVAVGGAEVSLELPEIAADAQVSVWAVPAEYRESGIFVGVRLRGQSQEIPACDLAACTHLGDVEYPAPEPMPRKRKKFAGRAMRRFSHSRRPTRPQKSRAGHSK